MIQFNTNTNKLTPKYMQEKLKIGWTTDDFCTDLGIENPDELEKILRKKLQRSANNFIKRLHTNKKIPRKKCKKQEEKISLMTSSEKNIEPIKENNQLEYFQEMEKKLRQDLFEIESEFCNKVSKKKFCKEKLEKSKLFLQSLLKKLTEEKQIIDRSIHQLTQIESEIQSLHLQEVEIQKELQEVRRQIDKLNVLVIYYKKEGEIVCDQVDEIPDNLDSENFLYDMMNLDILEDLSIKELKKISILLATAEYLKETTGRRIEFQFEENSNISAAIEILQEISEQ